MGSNEPLNVKQFTPKIPVTSILSESIQSCNNNKDDIPENSLVEIAVYDILGRQIKTLVNEVKQPGTYEVTYNSSGLSSGIYFYRLKANKFVSTRKNGGREVKCFLRLS